MKVTKIKVFKHKHKGGQQSRTPSPPSFPLINFSFHNSAENNLCFTPRSQNLVINETKSFLRIATDKNLLKKQRQPYQMHTPLYIKKSSKFQCLPPIQVSNNQLLPSQTVLSIPSKSNLTSDKILKQCSNLILLYSQSTFKKNMLLIIDINALGFVHESFFTPSSCDDLNDDEIMKLTQTMFKMVKIDHENIATLFFYSYNLKEQLGTLNKIFHIVLIIPEIKEVYLKALLSIQYLFDGVYLIEKKQHSVLVDFSQVVRDFGELKKIICLSSLESKLMVGEEMEVLNEMNLLLPYIVSNEIKLKVVEKQNLQDVINQLLRRSKTGKKNQLLNPNLLREICISALSEQEDKSLKINVQKLVQLEKERRRFNYVKEQQMGEERRKIQCKLIELQFQQEGVKELSMSILKGLKIRSQEVYYGVENLIMRNGSIYRRQMKQLERLKKCGEQMQVSEIVSYDDDDLEYCLMFYNKASLLRFF